MKYGLLLQVIGVGLAVTAAFAVGFRTGKRAGPEAEEAAAELAATQTAKERVAALLKSHRLYTILSGAPEGWDEALATLTADKSWVPSEIDVAMAVKKLATMQNPRRRGVVLMLLAREPRLSWRWRRELIDQIDGRNPANAAYPVYIYLLDAVARSRPDGDEEPWFDDLWRADDDRVVRTWAAYVSSRNAIGWQDDFWSWKESLDEKDLRRFRNTIAELEERAACVPARKPAGEAEVTQ